MIIVTAGKSFNDIDAFGCAIAYAELLRKEGKDAQAVFIGPLNHSVTDLAREQCGEYLTQYAPAPDDEFVYVDLSGPDHFAFPDSSNIIEIYDHHYGYEEYWKKRLGDQSHIERVGAAATLIWEEFKKRRHEKEITPSSVNLLALAILQNTLNFTSSETNDRDRAAFTELGEFITMPNGWQQRYFDECAKGMREHFGDTLRNDTKILEKFFEDQDLVFSQLEITEDPIQFLDRNRMEIDRHWSGFPGARCLVNIADISSKTSLLYSNDPTWLHGSLQPRFAKILDTAETWILVPIHQRKQILKMLQEG